MPFADGSSQLEPLLFQMKQYKNLTKTTIEILPSSGQTDYVPNRKCIFTLPYASLISLEDLALHFDFTPDHVPKAAGADCVRVMPPKDVASLISEIDIKINGQTVQHLTYYNDIVNLSNIFEDAKTAKKVLQGCDMVRTNFKGAAGSIGAITNTEYQGNVFGNNKTKEYIINHWYGLLGHRGKDVSSNFVDTNMLGEVTIAFTFATAATCVVSVGTETEVQASTNPPNAATTANIASAIAHKNLLINYQILKCQWFDIIYHNQMRKHYQVIFHLVLNIKLLSIIMKFILKNLNRHRELSVGMKIAGILKDY